MYLIRSLAGRFRNMKLFLAVNPFHLGCLLLLLAASAALAENIGAKPGSIVVTIKPLFSLVAQLTEGITTPQLLMSEAQSPHHYSMRPSERRLLSDASMIVWIGPSMEANMSKIIQQQKQATVVTAMQADNLRLLNKRKKHNHEEAEHQPEDSTEPDKLDPHIWLSINNATAISRQVYEALIKQDPQNTERYRQNLQHLLGKIELTAKFIDSTLQHRDQPFITFHDAFQYFEDETLLNYANSISFDEETGASLKHVRRIKADMDQYHIQCIVYQEPKPAIIDALSRQSTVTATALDPLGLEAESDKEAWFELMRQLATGFNQCLTPVQ
jgi:zinc transport system substrate-binding protein